MKDSIREEAGKINWKNMDEVIGFYESNYLYFNNYQTIHKIENIVDVIYFKQRYIEALDSKKRYSKAETILTDIDILLQRIKGYENYKTVYERYLFLSGLIKARLKKRQEALPYFKELCKIDPENDLYKNWYLSLRSNIYQNQFMIIGYFGTGIIVLNLILRMFFNYHINRYLFLLALLMYLVGFLYSPIHKLFIKIKKIQK